jgi:hypothetical protein
MTDSPFPVVMTPLSPAADGRPGEVAPVEQRDGTSVSSGRRSKFNFEFNMNAIHVRRAMSHPVRECCAYTI